MADKITLTPLFDVDETSQDVASTPERITLKPLDDSLPEFIQNRKGDEEGAITEIGEGIVSGLNVDERMRFDGNCSLMIW